MNHQCPSTPVKVENGLSEKPVITVENNNVENIKDLGVVNSGFVVSKEDLSALSNSDPEKGELPYQHEPSKSMN